MSAGIYLHIPFCLTKCGYCSFFSVPFNQPALNSYVQTLLKEAQQFKQSYTIKADSVYFGGGTPSLLNAGQINALLDVLQPAADAEITLEANPIQITSDWAKALATTGVNRLSLGVQSLQNENLQALGRKHTAESLPDRIKLLRDHGFNNISLDLMYGLPSWSGYNLKAELELFLALQPDHLSAYLLTLEDPVPYSHWKSILPDEAAAENQYYTICSLLAREGWEHYEISNFAKPGKTGRHNLHYWLGDPFAGLGAGASGFINNKHYKRPEDFSLWQFSVDRGDLLFETEDETRNQQRADFVIMQLRLMRGLELKTYRTRFRTDFIYDYQEPLERFLNSGHLEHSEGFIKLTEKAWFVSNRILQEFV